MPGKSIPEMPTQDMAAEQLAWILLPVLLRDFLMAQSREGFQLWFVELLPGGEVLQKSLVNSL